MNQVEKHKLLRGGDYCYSSLVQICLEVGKKNQMSQSDVMAAILLME